jgi:hypothetical protein
LLKRNPWQSLQTHYSIHWTWLLHWKAHGIQSSMWISIRHMLHTHSNSSQCWNVSWDIWATYSAGGRGLCKCFVDSDLSWAHARCLLKNPVILWSRLGGGKCLTVLLFSLFLFMHMQWCHGGRFLDSLLVSGGFIWGFKAYCHFVCVCVCLNLSWM